MTTAVPMPLAAQLAACSADMAALAGGLTEAQGRWRPGPGRWSVAECLAHLAATARQYQPGLDRAAATARERGRRATGPFRPGWLAGRLVAAMEPGGGARMRTTAALTPPAEVTLADAAREFRRAQDALTATLAAVDGLDLGSATLRSPVLPVLRLSLGTACAVLAAHERHHLAQARRVVEEPGFPTA